MNLTLAKTSGFLWIAENIRLLLQRPPRGQVAALCYRQGANGPEVLLITSRKTKRWIIPKGWPMANYSARKTARLEAFEEAGIIGMAAMNPIGEFASHKGLGNGFKVKTNISVYPLRIDRQISDFPERGKRKLAWLSLEEAANRCNEAGLRELLRSGAVKSLLMEG